MAKNEERRRERIKKSIQDREYGHGRGCRLHIAGLQKQREIVELHIGKLIPDDDPDDITYVGDQD